jgi:hypothetical protein
MIPALVVAGVLVGVIIGLAIAGWYHATTIAPPERHTPNWTAVGGHSGVYQIDAAYGRMLKPILERMGWEVRL